MPPQLRIQLLGAFDVRRDGVPISPNAWRGQKTRDLLKILLLARGRYVAADQLVEWLWPAAEPGAGTASLRAAVSDLRQLLEPGLARGRDSAFVLTRHEGYCFSPEAPVDLDLADFERALRSASRRDLETALARHPGELLEENPYAEWAQPERARLRDLRLDALTRVAALALAEGDPGAASAAAEAGLALDAGRETLWRALMQAHAQRGDRAAALAAFDRCRAALARDLGTDPLPETQALYQAILAGSAPPMPFVGAGSTRDAAAAPAQPAPAWLLRLAALCLGAWVLFTLGGLLVSLFGAASGRFISPGDPGSEALPALLLLPGALENLFRQLTFLLPAGLLWLPAYLAWFALLRAAAARAGRGATPLAWVGVALGGLDSLLQLATRAVSLIQLTVLPRAYAAAPPDQRLALTTLWDVLRQTSALLGTAGALINPAAVALLCLATLAALRAGRAAPLPEARSLAGWGLTLAALTLLYTFFSPPALAALWLPLGLALALANYAWLAMLATSFWAAARAA
jgi:DNA-binding SARP family transcriptional activator